MDTSTTEMLNENTVVVATTGDVLLVIAIFFIFIVVGILAGLGAAALAERIEKRRNKVTKEKQATEEFREDLMAEMQALKEADEKNREEMRKVRSDFRAGLLDARGDFQREVSKISRKSGEDLMLAVRGIVPKIIETLREHPQSKKGNVPARGESPLVLTEYGLKLSDAMDAETIAQSYISRMDKETQGMNAYQIQTHCQTFAGFTMMNELEKCNRIVFDRISDVAYKKNTTFYATGVVIGLLLRDEVFKLRGIDVPVGKAAEKSTGKGTEASAGVEVEEGMEPDAKSGK